MEPTGVSKCQRSVPEKLDELLVLARMNDVVTETWFKSYMASESVGLAGFCCRRKDRMERGGGGVACHVAEIMAYDRLHDIEDDEREVLWIRSPINYQENTRVLV